MTTKATQVVKKAKGLVIPTGLIVAIVVGVYGKQIVGWPLTVDKRLTVQATEVADIKGDVEDLEGFDLEQKKINEKVGDKMEELSLAQHSMALEQRGQHETLKAINKTLEKIERNGR